MVLLAQSGRGAAYASPYGRKARMVSPRAHSLLDEFMAALQPTPLQQIAPIGRTHALAEAVNALVPPIVRLVSPFHSIYAPALDESS